MLALTQAMRYWVGRYQLTFSTRGTVDGATYTDVERGTAGHLPAGDDRPVRLWSAHRQHLAAGLDPAGAWRWACGCSWRRWPVGSCRRSCSGSGSSRRSRRWRRPTCATTSTATRMAYGLDVETETFKWDGKLIAATARGRGGDPCRTSGCGTRPSSSRASNANSSSRASMRSTTSTSTATRWTA
jgi:hypothetical protein